MNLSVLARGRRADRRVTCLFTAPVIACLLVLGAAMVREWVDFALLEEQAIAVLLGCFVFWVVFTVGRAFMEPRRRERAA